MYTFAFSAVFFTAIIMSDNANLQKPYTAQLIEKIEKTSGLLEFVVSSLSSDTSINWSEVKRESSALLIGVKNNKKRHIISSLFPSRFQCGRPSGMSQSTSLKIMLLNVSNQST